MTTALDGNNRLEKTLASDTFAYKDGVTALVKNHLLKSTLTVAPDGISDAKDPKALDEATQYWSSKIWTFLDEIKSASASQLISNDESNGSAREWKLKDETDRHRVMYREGPEGTPFHTLCIDGIVNGDFPSALCVAWESPMFKEWWPQFVVPTFKITESKWLKRIRVGEDLSLLRFKVPWPLAQREVILSMFELEYLQDDLVFVVMESAPEADVITEKVHGYSASDIPLASSNVRMDVAGGFILQRMTKDLFYFRTLANLDVKLDFVPPWMINFMSRQLAGQGLKLYQKAVLAVSKGSGNGMAFQNLLKSGPLYDRVRSSLEAKTASNGDSFTTSLPVERLPRDSFASLPIERPPKARDGVKAKAVQGSIRRMGGAENNRVVPYPVKAYESETTITVNEIEATDKAFASEVPLKVVEPTRLGKLEESEKTTGGFDPNAVMENVTPFKAIEIKSKTLEQVANLPPTFGGSTNQATANKKPVLSSEDEVREYEDPELEWALKTLDKMILFTRSCETASATQDKSHESKSGRGSSYVEPSSRVEIARSNRKPPLPFKNEACPADVRSSKPAGSVTREPINSSRRHLGESSSSSVFQLGESGRSSGAYPAMGDTESVGTSGFWSASEIEIVSSQEDTDTDVGASGRVGDRSKVSEDAKLVSKPKVVETEVQPNRRRSKWRWACFSPSVERKPRAKLFTDENANLRESARISVGHWRSVMADSNRLSDHRGYATDGDDLTKVRRGFGSRRHSPDRFVTLGELLMDDER